jgi:hypothetical protein
MRLRNGEDFHFYSMKSTLTLIYNKDGYYTFTHCSMLLFYVYY